MGDVDGPETWRALLAAATSDRLSGARGISADAASVLVAYSQQNAPSTPDELVGDLREMSLELLRAQPAMASVVRLLSVVWDAVEGEASVVSMLQAMRDAAHVFVQQVRDAAHSISRQALVVMPPDARVVTLSASSTVAGALLYAWERGCRLRVTCLESRPMLEGQALAARLAEVHIPVMLTVDAAGYDAVREADVLFVGVDSLASGGVVGKVGTAGLALAAQRFQVPAYALADRTKIWPATLGMPVIRERATQEVWAEAPEGVRVCNRYFDVADWSAFAGVVTEDGVLGRDEVLEEGKAIRAHDDLAALYERLTEELTSKQAKR